jgi:hypothetical protein
VLERATQHQFHEHFLGQPDGRRLSHDPAVPHDADPVRDAEYLAEAVRDKQHSVAPLSDLTDSVEHSSDFRLGQAGRRLIQNK